MPSDRKPSFTVLANSAFRVEIAARKFATRCRLRIGSNRLLGGSYWGAVSNRERIALARLPSLPMLSRYSRKYKLSGFPSSDSNSRWHSDEKGNCEIVDMSTLPRWLPLDVNGGRGAGSE